MEISVKILVRMMLVANVSKCFLFVLANKIPSPSEKAGFVAPGQEPLSSARLAKVSYIDLFDLFGIANVADTVYEDKDDHDKIRLVEILRENLHKIDPHLRKIEEAFGTVREGRAPATRVPTLGFLEVTDLPREMVELRKRVLPQASKLANLPAEELRDLEKPESGYSIGWSHGRESFRIDDSNGTHSVDGNPKRRYDTAKGSFYMNPFADSDTTNVFPPSMQPSLEEDMLKMTRFMSKVGLWIAILCDLYLGADTIAEPDCSRDQDRTLLYHGNCAKSLDSTNVFSASIAKNPWMVYDSLKNGKPAAKARLLYYFPQGQKQQQQQQKEQEQNSTQIDKEHVYDDWCGWHTDHGTLTALLPGMISGVTVDQEQTEPTNPQLSLSHPKPGLYIKTSVPIALEDIDNFRTKTEMQGQQKYRERLVHVNLAPDSLGFQLGETLEILSGGKFVATPHAVKAPLATGASMLGRASLAVFLQPLASHVLPPLAAMTTIDRNNDSADGYRHHDSNDDALSLRKRWRSTFGEFQRVTIESFS
mmetsp:Transcript_18321/g.42205  ORF Transcript_18321/g.42205 Transcript_18321/m.42205 type:complete len:534 (+) Transcript_18321:120-1721(+)